MKKPLISWWELSIGYAHQEAWAGLKFLGVNVKGNLLPNEKNL
jgi:hypothetical protein